MKYEIYTNSPSETIAAAENIGGKLRGGDVIAFTGGLGAGKTTFTRGLARGMGLDEDEVCSPTFSIVNEYRGAITLYHFDMYRITDSEALESTGFYDYLCGDTAAVIEWSENITDSLPEGCIFINIDDLGDDRRRVTVEGDERFADIGN